MEFIIAIVLVGAFVVWKTGGIKLPAAGAMATALPSTKIGKEILTIAALTVGGLLFWFFGWDQFKALSFFDKLLLGAGLIYLATLLSKKPEMSLATTIRYGGAFLLILAGLTSSFGLAAREGINQVEAGAGDILSSTSSAAEAGAVKKHQVVRPDVDCKYLDLKGRDEVLLPAATESVKIANYDAAADKPFVLNLSRLKHTPNPNDNEYFYDLDQTQPIAQDANGVSRPGADFVDVKPCLGSDGVSKVLVTPKADQFPKDGSPLKMVFYDADLS